MIDDDRKSSPANEDNRPIALYPLSNYSFEVKSPIPERDRSIVERFVRLRKEYVVSGMRRTVEAIIITQVHKMPHVMLLKLGSTFFKLPGGALEDGEDDAEGLRRILSTFFGKPLTELEAQMEVDGKVYHGWEGQNKSCEFPCVIRETVSNWWRPHFEPTQYPYLPAHVTAPKEHRRLMLVELPPKTCFFVPSNYQLLAAPVFELYDNHAGYGPVISSIPVTVSRLNLVFVEDAGGATDAPN